VGLGELLDAVTAPGRLGRGAAGIAALVALVGACGQTIFSPTPTFVPSDGAAPTASSSAPASTTDPVAVDPAEGRLVWTVDATGRPGIWTTDLGGGDVRPILVGIEGPIAGVRDAILVGDQVVHIVDLPAGGELRTVVGGLPRPLLDRVLAFVIESTARVVAIRDLEAGPQIVRVPLDGGATDLLLEAASPADPAIAAGPFGVAVSPDGRSVAAGWVGGPVTIVGPAPATLDDVGAPLVVDDDGRLVATTGRAGEAYLLRDGRLDELAPPDSDPIVAPGSTTVAWGAVGDDGALRSVEVRDVVSGEARTFPAAGRATNVREVTRDHVLLEATAFDPLRRTVGYLDLRDGRFATFESVAPTPSA
jgi:hypothetical protein